MKGGIARHLHCRFKQLADGTGVSPEAFYGEIARGASRTPNSAGKSPRQPLTFPSLEALTILAVTKGIPQ
jgi:hypothetical protein